MNRANLPPPDVSQMPANPIPAFSQWLELAQESGVPEPTAFALASAGRDGRPSVRIVLFKGIVDEGLSFYTCYDGRKAQELESNPMAAGTFWWATLERQIRFEGKVIRTSREQSQTYFWSRPRISQLSAMTSLQSSVTPSREGLEARFRANEAKFEGKTIPLPDNWGGYVLIPDRVEFWQGRRGRLHDRIYYSRSNTSDSQWSIQLLEP